MQGLPAWVSNSFRLGQWAGDVLTCTCWSWAAARAASARHERAWTRRNCKQVLSWSGVTVTPPTAELRMRGLLGLRLCSSDEPGPAQRLSLCSCFCPVRACHVQRGRLQSTSMSLAASTYEPAPALRLQAMQSLAPSLLGPPGGPLMPSGPQTARQPFLTGSPSWPFHRCALLQSTVNASSDVFVIEAISQVFLAAML